MEAVSASLGPLGPLLEKLAALEAGEYGRMRGVRGRISSLRSELTSMRAALQDYMTVEEPDVEVKLLASFLRELAYDTDDCIDKFIHQLGSGAGPGGFKKFFRKSTRYLKTLMSLRGIADQIDRLKGRVNQVKQVNELNTNKSSTEVDPRLTAIFADKNRLVGIAGPRDQLSKWMLEEENMLQPRVLSIVGFGGLGKTTLAKQVYDAIQEHFDCRVFVPVGQKPDVEKLIKSMILQVPSPEGFTKDINIWDLVTCIEKLRELLQDKRYLFVIDDIWSTQVWDTIECALPKNDCCSRIIVTTRIHDVARSCSSGRDDCVYEMEALSDLDSRRLFFGRIFGSADTCPVMLEEVSNEILKKCGGLPLAIIAISSLLANRPAAKDEWEEIKRSIGSALDKRSSVQEMNRILSLSYNALASNLKTCLLYLSIFPEDYLIERDWLMSLWIAEGFIVEEQGMNQQAVAENYFNELISKCMILPMDFDYDGKPRACRVHDMMLDFIISKSIENNLTTVVGVGQASFAKCQGFIRRLSIQHIDEELASALANEDLSHVRSLIVTAGCIKRLPSLVKFGALRVLDFEDCEGLEDNILTGIDNLSQLKYVRLGGKAISKLPSGIVMLGSLETLDLRNTCVQELPARIAQLTKLKHLLAGGQTKIPNGIGDMRNLMVLSGFNITRSSADVVEELQNLISLNKLDIYLDSGGTDKYMRHEEFLLSSLCKLVTYKLKYVWIHKWCGSLEFLKSWSPLPSSLEFFCMSGYSCFTNIPKWIAPALSNLVHLEISLTEYREECLHTLGVLPGLRFLKLSFIADPVELITVQGTTGFQSLNKFVIYSVAGTYVNFMEGAMPRLEKFNVRLHVSLAKTYGFYLGIRHLPRLKETVISFYKVDATPFEIRAAVAVISDEASAHPNHPTIIISGECYDKCNEEIGSDEEDLR